MDLWVLVECYSLTRWLHKLRPAGTPHRWMGQGARWHLSWPLADTTAQKMTTFLDSCMSSLRLSMLFFSVLFKREIPRIMFVILTQRPCSPVLVLTWRSSYADTVGGRGKNWQELRPMYRRDSSPGYSTRIPYVSPIPSYITARQQFPESCNSLLETAHTQKKTTCHLRGHAAQKKKTQYVLFLYMPKRRPKSRSCHRKPLCTRAVLISVLVFESIRNRRAECHIASRVIPADDSYTLPFFEEFLQSPQRSGAQAPSIAHLLPTLPRHQRRSPALACMARRTRCPLCPTPPAQVQRWPPSFHLKRASSVCVVSRGPSVPFGCTSPSHRASWSASNELPTWCVITVTSSS